MLAGLFCASYCAAALAKTTDKPPFYQIEYQGKRAYLLGSIHVGRVDFYPMAPQIAERFSRAGALVVEADVKDAEVQSLVQRYGMRSGREQRPPPDSDTRALMSDFCLDKVPLCESLSSFAPWLQSMQLGLFRFAQLGYQAEHGVDVSLIRQNQDRPLLQLESAEFQLKLMASFDEATQWAMVREAIVTKDSEMQALIDSWRSGDEATLASLMTAQLAPGEGRELLDKLLWQRNISMAEGIVSLMDDTELAKPLFIVVGAGHLVGEKSIPEYLVRQGARLRHCWRVECQ
jgi:uncharacterized protein